MHWQTHAFDDVVQKGVARNFGTKIDEAMHGAIRTFYLQRTNFKDVAPQVNIFFLRPYQLTCNLTKILRYVHRSTLTQYIRDQLDVLDGVIDDDADSPTQDIETDLEVVGNAHLGAKRKPLSFSSLEEEMKDDLAFRNFRIRFGEFLNNFLPIYGHALPDGKRIRFHAEQEVSESERSWIDFSPAPRFIHTHI